MNKNPMTTLFLNVVLVLNILIAFSPWLPFNILILSTFCLFPPTYLCLIHRSSYTFC